MVRRRLTGRGAKGYSERSLNIREQRQRFLIVCEGEKTEPNYFRRFRTPKVVIEVQGLGCDPIQLVRRALELRREDDYDQVWCVFDRDTWPASNFNEAISLAKQNKVSVAYSNEAFEMWYLLHFHYFDTALSRHDYGPRLSDLLEHPYTKNSGAMYDELLPRQPEALRNAERLLAQYQPPNPAADNPSTTVHLLVNELNRFAA